MTDTPNLGLPFIEGGQAQKHVTHNEALRILDAAIQIVVRDTTRTAPPAAPADGARHVVATGATGAWAGHAQAIAIWQDGAWAYLVPRPGWCVWSLADDGMLVFDGTLWRAVVVSPPDSVSHLGINAVPDSSNLLSVKSNAALFAAIDAAHGGNGDMRVQLSKDGAARTSSVVFSNNYSSRAEFGLVGSDAFKLKVAPDGSAWVEAFTIDQTTGNLTLPRGLALSGVIAPSPLTADQNDYAQSGIAASSVMQLSADAARRISGLAGGSEGRLLSIVNVGSQPITLLDEAAASAATNRFALSGSITLNARQAVILRYDGTAGRWQALAGSSAAAPVSGMANRLINPNGAIWQLANSGAAAITDAAYAFDQWYGLTQVSGVTAGQVIDAENGTPMLMRLTQPSATAQRFGLAQPIEAANIKDTRGKAITLSSRVRMSAAATLRYAIVEYSGAPDALLRDVVNDWTSSSYTSGGFFISANTVVAGVGAVALAANTLTALPPLTVTPSGTMNNLILLFWTDGAQPQSVSLDIGKVQLEVGASATVPAARLAQEEQALCNRYLRVIGNGSAVFDRLGFGMAFSATIFRSTFVLENPMRIAPAVTISAASDFILDDTVATAVGTSYTALSNPGAWTMQINVASGLTASRAGFLLTNTLAARIYLKAQL